MGSGLVRERVFRVRTAGASTGTQGPWRFGSGYLVASGRVLTAGHVLIPPDRVTSPRIGEFCEVLPWPGNGDNWQPSMVLWVDEDRDLAVVSAPPSVEVPDVRFGRLDGNAVETWQAIGFPLASLGASGRRPDPASGTTMGLGVGTLELTVTSRNPRPRDDESGWAGLSGAAVFCGGYLVGVVSKDVEDWEQSLQASEVAPVVSSADFAKVLPHPPSLEQATSDLFAGTKIYISGPVTIEGEAQGTEIPRASAGDVDATSDASVGTPRDLDAVVDDLLQRAGPQRTPIVVAIETTSQTLTDEDLLRTRRHLTVSLPAESVERCASLASSATAATSLDDLASIGAQIWNVLLGAQPRLAGLLDGMGEAAAAQPVAWAGHCDLLDQLHRALVLAHTGTGGTEGFVSVGYGGHYLQPASATTKQRSVNPKRETPLEVAVLDATQAANADDAWKAAVRSAAVAEIVLAAGAPDHPADVSAIADDLASVAGRHIRALLGLSTIPLDASAANRLLTAVPFVSVAQDADVAELRDVLRSALGRHGSVYAMPCIVAAVRAAWLSRAAEAGDTHDVLAALEWTSWSWVGLTLFGSSYVQPEGATYPHLDDLRSVAGSGWYYPRHKDIPEEYTGEALSGIDIEPARRFHLYLSGVGGTGKSCFLRYVHDELDQRANQLAVWYRVDAPGSTWDMLQQRIREEVLHAARDRHPAVAEELEAISSRRLSMFLRESVQLLRERLDPGFEITVFIDQLERTFESSDEPDPYRLETISKHLLTMLDEVDVGQGVRVFIASRKQYLPDFLRSSRAITEYGLQFNVLQPVTDDAERKEFVRQVVDWCRDEKLVSPNVELRSDAAEMLVSKARGSPLNTMLALIQLLSADVDGPITVADLERYKPWEQLFALDLAAARQDDIDWYFLLAMAHTRTEIVRFADVWWRLRLVDPRLTQQVDVRGTEGVREQLRFHGFLGRTLHSRAAGDDPARYVEFFHANLRDHLLSEVMASATARDPLGARSGAPAAWRALDRLAAFAHDWEQTQQLLPAEDVRALMEHRDVVVESHQALGSHDGPFDLLFLRNQEDARPGLMRAATECLVLSALVRDDLGSWAFQRLFPKVEDRVALCLSWLRSGSRRNRGAVLRYVVEQEYAWEGLTRFVLDEAEPLAEDTADLLAVVLAEPLYAARYRNDVLSVVIETAAKAAGSAQELPTRVVRLLVAACGFEGETLARLVAHVKMRAGLDQEQDKSPAAGLSEALVPIWLQQAADSGLELVGWSEQPLTLDQAALGLVVGENLASIVDRRALERWSAELRSRLGVPIPALRLVRGECLPDELELRFATERVQANVFYADRVCVLRRHWETTKRALPPDAVPVYDSAGEEDVVWLGRDALKGLDSTLPIRELEETVVDWLEAHCRREFDRLFDDELLIQFVQEATLARRWDRLIGYSRDQVRSIIVGLVEEGVPLDGPGWDLNQRMRRIGVHEPETVIRLVRDTAKHQISESLVDSAGVVNAIVLDERMEQSLGIRRGVRGEPVLVPDGTYALTDVAAAVRRQVEAAIRQDGLHMPVLVTQSLLRAPLSNLLRRFDVRLKVLSFTELDPDVVSPVLVGMVRSGSEDGPRP